MENDPLYQRIVDKAWSFEILSKIKKLDAFGLESFELDSCLFEQVMRLINDFLFIDIKLEIELPCADRVWHITLLVRDRQTNLYEFGFLNIGPD